MARTNTAPAHAPEGMPRARAWVEHLDRLPNVFFLPFGHIPSLASSLRAAVHEADRLAEELATVRRQLDAAEAQPAEVWVSEPGSIDYSRVHATELGAKAAVISGWVDDNPDLGYTATFTWIPATIDDEAHECLELVAEGRRTGLYAVLKPVEPSEPEPNPLESAVTEALADIAADPADPEPAPTRPPWLVEAGDD